MNKRTKAYLAVILGNIIFGFSFMASKIALSYTSPEVFLAIRFALSFLVLSLMALFGLGKLKFRGKNIVPLLLLGLCQPGIYFLCENYGIQNASTSFAGIMIGLIPVVALILAAFFNKEPLSGKKILLSCLSVAGIVVLSVTEQSEGSVNLVGILCLFGAVLAGAMFNVITRKSAKQFTALERTYVMFAFGTVMYTGIALFKTKGHLIAEVMPLFSHKDFNVALIYLSVLSSVLAFLCLNYAAEELLAQQTASFANLTTVISVLAGVLILKESFSIWHGVGIVMVLISIYRLNRLTN